MPTLEEVERQHALDVDWLFNLDVPVNNYILENYMRYIYPTTPSRQHAPCSCSLQTISEPKGRCSSSCGASKTSSSTSQPSRSRASSRCQKTRFPWW
ncbi:MAG: hypothetical protein [Cressdnaviricota sp.]|nr:MAG: hypothetical protein [Cressdnaviricota sp.]